MAKRRLTSRQKRQRTRKIRNRVILILALLSLASAAMAPELRAYLTAKIHSGVQAFADVRGWPGWACHAPSGRMRACG